MRKIDMLDLIPGSMMAISAAAQLAAGVPEVSLLPIDCGWDVRVNAMYTDLRHLGSPLSVVKVKYLDPRDEAVELTGQLHQVCKKLSRERYLMTGYTEFFGSRRT